MNFDFIIYIGIALVVCGIFAAIVIPIAKRDNETLESIKEKVPPEKLNELQNQIFESNPSYGKDMFISKGLVANIRPSEKNYKGCKTF